MNSIDYIGFDIHKKTISFCAKAQDGRILDEGTIPARRTDLSAWAERRSRPWWGAMEATLFTGWVYDHLKPLAQELKVAHPAMLKAITASKKKNDKVDARKVADLLRCDLLPECYMAPSGVRELRRVLRYRNLVVRQATRMKNRIAGLLMETGTLYNKERLHGKAYFGELLGSLRETPVSVIDLLKLSRAQLELFVTIQQRLVKGLRADAGLRERVERLQSIRSVGEILALTWALEIGEVNRFTSIADAVSYCGLTSAQHNSAGKEHRGPISKQRNKHLQTILIEAAKLAPRYNPQLAAVHERELQRGNRNRATLAVARKLVAYLMAVDKSGKPFQVRASAGEANQDEQPWVDFAAIKRSVDIQQVLDHYRVRLKRVRKDYFRGLCPLPTHGSKQSQESFGVDTGKKVWACHSTSCCQARQGKVGGNILDLVACMEACSVREAALRLRGWSDVSVETGLRDLLVSKGKRPGRSQEELPRLSFTLRLQCHPYLEQRGIQEQTAAWFGVGYYGGSGFLRGRMVFPIHDERGELVAYAGRTMDGREPRYLFPPGFHKSQVVFNLHRAVEFAAGQGGVAIVVEGFFDCLKVHQAGYGNVVALMGASPSDRQSELLHTYFRELVVMLDGDETGRRASRALVARWPAASMAWVPAGWQPDQLSSEEIKRTLLKASAALGA